MPRFKIAHVKEQGIELIIIPLESTFGDKTPEDQRLVVDDLQRHAMVAGLAGNVVPVWKSGKSRMGFFAPPNWHPFFKTLTFGRVVASLNRELNW
jgi:hypothetical protein